MVVGHLGINVPDLELARAYYAEVMPLVGFESFLDASDEFAYMPAHGKRGTYLFFYETVGDASPYSVDTTVGLQHLAFMMRDRASVDRVHDWVTASGGISLEAPRVFSQYPQPYYATFWFDPFGLKLEAVCHHDA